MQVRYLTGYFGLLIAAISTVSSAESAITGTGFAVGDGSVIVTANHVVKGCTEIKIPDVGTASVLRSDERADLALLKPSRPLTAGLRFRSGHPIRLGEEVVVIGYPLHGLLSTPPTVTTGIVSSLAGIRDDPTEMQISAPVQPGNSGGPVLDRSGNVVGVVESKLDAVKAAMITGDIPQNVNFAIHSSIVTSLLDSYALKYDVSAFESEKSVADIVAAAVPTVVILECEEQQKPVAPAVASAPAPAPSQPASAPPSGQSAFVCGRPVEFSLDTSGTGGLPPQAQALVGVWAGTWNNTSRLCGGLIVERFRPSGTADIIYVYGPSRPGSRFPWNAQHHMAFINGSGTLTFQDDQGSNFSFDFSGPGALNAQFGGRSGRLTAVFQKMR